MKAYKKDHGLSSIDVIMQKDGFWYFRISRRTGGRTVYGIVDKNWETLFECKYEKLFYLNGIDIEGYREYTFPYFEGGSRNFTIYCYPCPPRFIACESGYVSDICSLDGSVIGHAPGNSFYVGNWIFSNVSRYYVRYLQGAYRLAFANTETYDLSLSNWSGERLTGDRVYYITISDKDDVWGNGAFVYSKGDKVGGLLLENLLMIAPSEYSDVTFDHKNKIVLVKKTPAEEFHVYQPDSFEEFVPKNDGERYLVTGRYKECLEYYSSHGVDDADSKLYAARAMYAIAATDVEKLSAYAQNKYGNQKPDKYDYYATKDLLESAIIILETLAKQDTSKETVCQENIRIYERCLADLEEAEALKKENSFWNQLARAFAEQISQSITTSAVNSISHNSWGSGGSSKSGNSATTSSSNDVSSNDGEIPAWEMARYRQLERDIESTRNRLSHIDAKTKHLEEERLQRYINEYLAIKEKYNL